MFIDSSSTYPTRTAQRNLNRSLFGADTDAPTADHPSHLSKHLTTDLFNARQSNEFTELISMTSDFAGPSSPSSTTAAKTNSNNFSTRRQQQHDVYVKKEPSEKPSNMNGNVGSDCERALRNDVTLSQQGSSSSLFSPNMRKVPTNGLMSELNMDSFSPVHMPQNEHQDHGE